ncbi:phage terminase small subunit-related protein [Paenibacillus sp. UKAQ_18]|nr:phage terminase small subunit-related protein [Paenibacillus sp. UKAQ_18]
MSKERSTNRKKALKIWLDSGRSIKLKDIALSWE